MENQIVITHYVNPHRFWYKPYRMGSKKKEQKLLQDAIDDYCEAQYENKESAHYEPMLGEVVAFYDPIQERWIRCSVDGIVDDGKALGKYRLWALDEGMPKIVVLDQLRPLPEKFQDKSSSHVKRGAIKNIFPAQNVFDPQEEKLCKRKSQTWNSFANTTIQSFIDAAQQIYFENVLSYTIAGESIDFGELLFVTKSKTFNAIAVLSDASLGLIVEPRNFIAHISETEALFSSHTSSVSGEPTDEGTALSLSSSNNALNGTKCRDDTTSSNEINEGDFDESVSTIGPRMKEVNNASKHKLTPNLTPTLETAYDTNTPPSALNRSEEKENSLSSVSISKKPTGLVRKLQMIKKQMENSTTQRASTEPKVVPLPDVPIVSGAAAASQQSQDEGFTTVALEQIRNDTFSLTIDVGQTEQREYELMHAKKPEPVIPPSAPSNPETPTSTATVSDTPAVVGKRTGANRLKEKLQRLANEKANQAANVVVSAEKPAKNVIPPMGFAPAGITFENQAKPAKPQNSIPVSVQNNTELKRFEKLIQEEKCIFSRRRRYRVLVHGANIPKPIDSIVSANFSPTVHRELEQMGFKSLFRLQAYSWPHIMRENSFICVNSANTGKTFAYLPAVCSVVQRHINESLVPPVAGPVCIIVCSSSCEVQRVGYLCRKMLLSEANPQLAVYECFGIRNVTKICNLLFNGCAILVTTAPCYQRLHDRMPEAFVRRRIQMVVIDNIEEILPHFTQELRLLCKACDKQGLQMIVTVSHWVPELASFFRRYNNMIVCIGAFIEAAVYANAQFLLRLGRGTDKKQQELIQFINERNYRNERMIVFGNDSDDLEPIVEALRQNSINHLVCNERTTVQQHSGFRNWDDLFPGDISVLVCSDAVLGDLDISNAQHIIHYSLPPTWSTFTRRFATSFGYYDCPYLEHTDGVKKPASTMVLLNENNNQQLPKLIDFLELHRRKVPEEMVMLAQNIRGYLECARITDGKAVSHLCTRVLGFAVCRNARTCEYRHALTENDMAPPDVPRSGTIRMKICHVSSPAHFSVRLKALRPEGSTTWTTLNDGKQFLLHDISLQSYFANEERHMLLGEVRRNELCAVLCEQNYCRGRIINHEEPKTLGDVVDVQLRLIDVGRIVHRKSSNLLTLPDQFRTMPEQAVDVRIAAIVPHDFEQDWDKTATNIVRQWIEIFSARANSHIQGNVLLAIRGTIWVDELSVVEQLEGLGTAVTTEKIRSNIISKQFGIGDKESFERIHQLVRECELLWRDSTSTEGADEQHKVNEKKESTSDTKMDEEESSTGLSNSGEMKEVSQAITVQVPDSLDTLDTAITITRPLQVPDSLDTLDTVLIEDDINRSASSPFEIISPTRKRDSSQYDFDSLSVGDTYNIMIGRYYSPDNFYVFQCDKIAEILAMVDVFSAKEANLIPLVEEATVVGEYCLFLFENRYQRGRIMEVLDGNLDREDDVVVFFLDYGGSTTCYRRELFTIPENLLKEFPFAAIKGKLAYLIPPANDTNWKDEIADAIYDDVLEKYNNGTLFADVIDRLPLEGEDHMDGCHYYELHLMDANANDKHVIMREIVSTNLAICMMGHETDCEYGNNYEADDDDEDESFVQVDFTHEEVRAFLQGAMKAQNGKSTGSARIVEVTEEESAVPVPDLRLSPYTDASSLVSDGAKREVHKKPRAKKNPTTGKPESGLILPRLQCDYRYPQTVWRQDDFSVIIQAYAPDVSRYDLVINDKSLLLRFLRDDDGQRYVLPLNLFNPIEHARTIHEVRGLAIVVRLLKLVPTLRWPTLLNHTGKLPWLKEVVGAVDGTTASGSDEVMTENRWHDLLPTKMDSPLESTGTYSSDEVDDYDLEEAMEDDIFIARK